MKNVHRFNGIVERNNEREIENKYRDGGLDHNDVVALRVPGARFAQKSGTQRRWENCTRILGGIMGVWGWRTNENALKR